MSRAQALAVDLSCAAAPDDQSAKAMPITIIHLSMDMLPSRRLVKLYEHLREVLADFIYVKCDWAMTAFRLDEHIVGRERCRASQQNRAAHVRFGSKAEVKAPDIDVRFTPNSGHDSDIVRRPLCAKSRHGGTQSVSSKRGRLVPRRLWELKHVVDMLEF
jgi:hypothetical protein